MLVDARYGKGERYTKGKQTVNCVGRKLMKCRRVKFLMYMGGEELASYIQIHVQVHKYMYRM